MRYVIIGNSAAGCEAALSLRKLDPNLQITIISDEDKGPYSRCLLPKFIDGRLAEDRLYFKTKHFFKDYNLRAFLGTKVVEIERSNKKVITGQQEEIAYDKLLLATGSYPFLPNIRGLELKGVSCLYSLQDSYSILETAKEARQAIVIGAGFVGLEAAYAMAKLGLKVKVIERCNQILPNQFDTLASNILKEDLGQLGVEIILNDGLSFVYGKDKVEGVVVGNKFYFECQLVIMACGMRPNIELAKRAGLKVDKGLCVNEYLETSDPDIYAAGDVIEVDDLTTGKRIPSATWFNAVLQGRFAGVNMLGGGRQYTGAIGIQNAAQFHEIPAISYGKNLESDKDEAGYEVMSLYIKEKKIYKKLVLKDEKLCGMLFVGDISKSGFYASLIREGIDISGVRHKLLDSDFSSAYFNDEEGVTKREGFLLV